MPSSLGAERLLAIVLCGAALASCESLLPYSPSGPRDSGEDTGRDHAAGRDARDAAGDQLEPLDHSLFQEPGAAQTVTFYSTKDTMIDLQGADANYGKCADIFMQNAFDAAKGRVEEYRVLFAFDLASVGSACTVKTAALQLSIQDTSGPVPVTVNQVLEDWDEGVGPCGGTIGCANWNSPTLTAPWSTKGGTASPAGVATVADGALALAWNATALAQSWVATPSTNHGVMLTTSLAPPSSHYVKFRARETTLQADRPKLAVTFTCP